MGLYGTEADKARRWLKAFGGNVHSNVEYWERYPHALAASVNRSFNDYHHIANELRERVGVAKKAFENSTWKGFIQCTLSAEQKEAYAAWDIQDADVWDGLASYGEKGYKFTLTYNKQNSNWTATYVGSDDAGKNAGWAVTAFAADPYNAARVLLFKVSAVLPDDWTKYKPQAIDAIG